MEILMNDANEHGIMIWDLHYTKLWLRVSYNGLILVKGAISVDHTMFNVIGVDVL